MPNGQAYYQESATYMLMSYNFEGLSPETEENVMKIKYKEEFWFVDYSRQVLDIPVRGALQHRGHQGHVHGSGTTHSKNSQKQGKHEFSLPSNNKWHPACF